MIDKNEIIKTKLAIRQVALFFLLAVPVLLVQAIKVEAYGNHLDYTFSGNGLVGSINGSSAPDVAVQSDDKVVIASGTQGNFRLVRLNSNGTIDTSFAGDGSLSIDFGVAASTATAVAIQPDGKIVVAGYAGSDFAVARVNASGILDLSFSNDGRATFDFQGGVDFGRALALLPNGKIVVVGDVDGGLAFGVLQLNADGSPDTSFSSDGKVITDIGGEERAYDVGIGIDGKIVVAGTTRLFGSSHDDFAVVRYNTNGTLDTTFDADGRLTTDFNGLNNRAFAMKLLPSGAFVVAGDSSVVGGYSAITIARYSAAGVLDPSFSGVGWGMYNLNPDGSEHVFDLVVNAATGDMFLGGSINNTEPGTDMLLMRVLGNGRLDHEFGTGGRVITIQGRDFHLAAHAIAMNSSGKIVVAGTSHFEPASITTLFAGRYTLDGAAAPADMTGDAVADYAIFRPSTGANWILDSQSGANSAFQFGATGDIPVPGDYDRDGKTDIAVYRQGTWYVLRSSNLSYFAVPFGVAGDKPTQADFDGDGLCDPAVFRPSNGTWYVSNTTGFISSIQFGLGDDLPVQADYDGDGLADVSVFRPSTGTWYLQRSKFGFVSRQFGLSGDRPVPADYDADGRADISVWRPSSGVWYTIRSQSNSITTAQFGSPGDIPGPANFDFDGKADLTVFRPSNGVWYVQKSSGGTNIVQYGLAGDIPFSSAYTPQ